MIKYRSISSGFRVYTFWILVICLTLMVFAQHRVSPGGKERFDVESAQIKQTMNDVSMIGGSIPPAVERFIRLTCIRCYDRPDFAGAELGCLTPGMHQNEMSLAMIRKTRSLRVPKGYFIQIYGKGGDAFSSNGTSDLDDNRDLKLKFDPQLMVVSKTQLMTPTDPNAVPDGAEEFTKFSTPETSASAMFNRDAAVSTDFVRNSRIDKINADLSMYCDNDLLPLI